MQEPAAGSSSCAAIQDSIAAIWAQLGTMSAAVRPMGGEGEEGGGSLPLSAPLHRTRAKMHATAAVIARAQMSAST